MARRIRWQILIAVLSTALVVALMSYLAVSSAAVQQPIEGGDYVEGLLYTPQQINPLVGDPLADQGAADLQALAFDGMVRFGPDGLPEPALVRSWTLDETGTTYTFTLREGVLWHDGQPLTVDDLLFTIRAIQGPAFSGNQSLRAVWRGTTVDRIDDQTIICRLDAPFAAFLEYATFPILPAHLLAGLSPEQWATSSFARQPVGTGPYQIAELGAERALLRANPSYYRGRPYIDSFELRYYTAPQTALNDLVRGELQGLSFASTSELRDVSLPRTIERRSAPLDGYTILTFNLRDGPLADQGLRRALAVGLDRAALADTIFGGDVTLLDTPVLPQWWASAADAEWYAPDRAQAAGLLDDLGYTPGADGVRRRDGAALAFELLTDSAPDRVAAAEEVARQWRLLGAEVTVAQVEPAELQQRLSEHRFSMAIHAWQRIGGDPDLYELWHSTQAGQGRNYAGLADADLDALIDRTRQESDLDLRRSAYESFQKRWVELAPSIPLYQPRLIYATSTALGGADALPASGAQETSGQLLIGREGRFLDVTRWFLRSTREIRGDLRQP
jgi:peptide/nickel transport system substrate-binding protein